VSVDTIEAGTTIILPSVKAIDGDQDSSDITDLITITTSLGDSFTGGGSYNLGDFGVEYTEPEQILVTYTAISPTSEMPTAFNQTININVGELAPTVNISPSPLAGDSISLPTGEMRHTVPFEEGVDYFDKYVYNPDTTHILYSATDPNEGSLTNDIEFGILTGLGDGTPSIEMVDVMGQAQAHFESGTGNIGVYSMYFSALVYDSSGLYGWAYWRINVTNEAPEVPILLGDTNLDGIIDILDIVNLGYHIMGVDSYGNDSTLEGEALANADFNADGAVDVADVVSLMHYILGI